MVGGERREGNREREGSRNGVMEEGGKRERERN